MNTIPPNNLDQLVAWIRVFAEEVQEQLFSYREQVQELQKVMIKLQNKEKEK